MNRTDQLQMLTSISDLLKRLVENQRTLASDLLITQEGVESVLKAMKTQPQKTTKVPDVQTMCREIIRISPNPELRKLASDTLERVVSKRKISERNLESIVDTYTVETAKHMKRTQTQGSML